MIELHASHEDTSIGGQQPLKFSTAPAALWLAGGSGLVIGAEGTTTMQQGCSSSVLCGSRVGASSIEEHQGKQPYESHQLHKCQQVATMGMTPVLAASL